MPSKKLNLYNIFLHLMLAALAVVIILLIDKNNELTEAMAKFNPPQLKVGEVFKSQKLIDLIGNEIEMDFKSPGKKLPFIFTTTCPYCKKSLSNWENLNIRLKDKMEIIGISADSLMVTKKFVLENNIKFKVYVSANPEFRTDNKISGVPQTIFINEKGIVEKINIGLISESEFDEILNEFKSLSINN